MDCVGRNSCCGTQIGTIEENLTNRITNHNDLVPLEDFYPYENFQRKCKKTFFNPIEKCESILEQNSIHIGNVINQIKVENFNELPTNTIIRYLNENGPITPSIVINSKALLFSFAFYDSGIIKDIFPHGFGGSEYYEEYGMHTMILYGFERFYNHPVWTIRNSWGPDLALDVKIDAKEKNPFNIFDVVTTFSHNPPIVLPMN